MTTQNPCGECTACCIILPIADPQLAKPAGEPCKHLCAAGCGIYETRFTICQDYLCAWLMDEGLNQHPLYRPDRLGVIFDIGPDTLALFEVTPGSLQSPTVATLKNRLRTQFRLRAVKNYPVGVLDGIQMTPGRVDQDGQAAFESDQHHWERLGRREYILRRSSSRKPLPMTSPSPPA